ncbi:hypothetical protein BAUCODRAFT_127068 [Baudoinia panamericana UAMH 10762]|uniref:Uncharacterized protein n=1 Tax=Baudoinia panamericana (strain UAMH 10762) TaxID=717646 RepID=M2MWZ1_BAUPA|nr:uncharacterized protein BAUCODRAFT_127068 [Baudoinia panamericana UAMH 10762]EMC91149.1 hypothetical protein BAUCODRAFT_127068 [Baudoinia panamericana UAMH 10762]
MPTKLLEAPNAASAPEPSVQLRSEKEIECKWFKAIRRIGVEKKECSAIRRARREGKARRAKMQEKMPAVNSSALTTAATSNTTTPESG